MAGERDFFSEGLAEAVKKANDDGSSELPEYAYSVADRNLIEQVATWMKENGEFRDMRIADFVKFKLEGQPYKVNVEDKEGLSVVKITKAEDKHLQ